MQSLKRIRYVTENYNNLQGLRWVAWGVLCLLVAAEDAGWVPTWALLFGILPVGLFIFWFMGTYYTRSYGKVDPVQGENTFANMLLPWLPVVSSLILARLADDAFDLPIFLTPLPFAGILIYFYIAAGRPYRWYYPLVALLMVGVSLMPLWVPIPAGSPWERPGFFSWVLIGLAMIVNGLFDHFLLAGTLKPISEENHG